MITKAVYTKEIVDMICGNIERGLSAKDSYIGIVDDNTFYKWLKVRPEFKEAVRIAEIKCKKRAIFLIQKAMIDSPQWAAWWLERKHFEEFSPRQKIDAEGNIVIKLSKPKDVDPKKM